MKDKGQLALTVTIHDCEVQTFRCGGKGGQKQNKTSSGARVIHHPSGARGESREHRSQLMNKRTAFIRMVQTSVFTAWYKRVLSQGPTAEERVKFDMAPENLKIETRVDGVWQQTG